MGIEFLPSTTLSTLSRVTPTLSTMAPIATPAARAATAYARSVVLAPRARTLYAPRHLAQGPYPCPCHPGPSRLGGPSTARYSDSAPARGDAATGGLDNGRSSTGASESSGALEGSALPGETQEARDGQQVRTHAPAPSPAPASASAPEARDPYSLTEDFLRGAAADTAEKSAADADNGAMSASASGLSEREKAQKEDEMVQRDWLQALAHG